MREYQGLSLLSVYLPLQHSKGGWVAELLRPNPKYDPAKNNSDPFIIERVSVDEIHQASLELFDIITEAKLTGRELPKDITENFESITDIVRQIPGKVQKHSERILPRLNISF